MMLLEKIKTITKSKYKIKQCEVAEKDCVSGTIGIFASVVLILFMVGTIVYALYLFLHISGVSNLAGVHVTASIKSAIDEIKNGKTDQIVGYEGWLTYKNDIFELRYPGDWKMQELQDGAHIVSLKKYKETSNRGSELLTESVYVNVYQVDSDVSIKSILDEKGVKQNAAWKKVSIGGKPGMRTGKVETESGIIKDIVFWEIGDRVYLIEVDYLSDIIPESENTFEKIIAQFKFI